MSKPAIAFRKAGPADLAFIVDSWVDSYRTAHSAGMLAMYPLQQPLETKCDCGARRAVVVDYSYDFTMRVNVNAVIVRPGVETWVAYRPGAEEGDDLYGWICVERGVKIPERIQSRTGGVVEWVTEMVASKLPLVHYVYTKAPFRELGIANALFQAADVDLAKPFFFSCKTGLSSQLERLKAPQARWMPLLVRYPKR